MATTSTLCRACGWKTGARETSAFLGLCNECAYDGKRRKEYEAERELVQAEQ